jgi:hypothetical protein
VNGIGFSALSDQVLVNPIGLPDPPDGVEVVAGDSWVEISWLLPLDDGGSEIIQITIFRSSKNGTTVPIVMTVLEGLYRDIDVQNGVTYTYTMTAQNVKGSSDISKGFIATPSGKPGAPRTLTVIEEGGSARLTWQVPGSDGGSPILGYRVYRAGPAAEVNIGFVSASALSFLDTGISEDVTLTYYITAVNMNGESPRSKEVQFRMDGEDEAIIPLIIAVVVILLLIAACLNWIIIKRWKMRILADLTHPDNGIPSHEIEQIGMQEMPPMTQFGQGPIQNGDVPGDTPTMIVPSEDRMTSEMAPQASGPPRRSNMP